MSFSRHQQWCLLCNIWPGNGWISFHTTSDVEGYSASSVSLRYSFGCASLQFLVQSCLGGWYIRLCHSKHHISKSLVLEKSAHHAWQCQSLNTSNITYGPSLWRCTGIAAYGTPYLHSSGVVFLIHIECGHKDSENLPRYTPLLAYDIVHSGWSSVLLRRKTCIMMECVTASRKQHG